MKKLVAKLHQSVYGIRMDARPGIKYFSYKDFNNLKADKLSFINKNGYRLNGYFYFKDGSIKDKLIIFCHGMGGGHQAYINEINYLCDNGFKVATFDYQGCVLSEGDNVNSFLQPAEDIDLFINHINSFEDYKNINKYIIGHSWGGFVAHSACHFHKDIKKLVMISGLISIKSAFDQYVPWYACIFKKSLLNYEKSLHQKYFNCNAIETINKRDDLSSLIIHSIDDKIVSYKYNFLKLKKASKNTHIKFISVNNKNHNPQYTYDAVKKLTAYLHELNKLKTIKEKNLLADKTDFASLCELDKQIMDEIVLFLKS